MDAFVAQHLRGVSRTYAILIPMLPGALADAVGAAYLLMRIVDTLEDDPELATAQRLACLAQLEAALAGDEAAGAALARPRGETAAEHALMSAVPDVVHRVRGLEAGYRVEAVRCARVMSDGVRTLTARSAARGLPYPAVRDVAELREYCYYVAGVVGEMLCTMMAHFLKQPALTQMRALAIELGTGLQLVNILKDALPDAAHGRRYLPPVSDGAAHAEIYRAVLNETRQCLRRGIDYVLALPASARELRTFCGLPIAWGALTLARAEHDASAAKIGRPAIEASITRFAALVDDDTALREWLGELLASRADVDGSPQPMPPPGEAAPASTNAV
jgi:farnesyl-diphosphate farnesyltransferase